MNSSLSLRPSTMVYLLLMVITFFTWYAGVAGLSGLTITFTVLGLSLLKAHLIGDYYMGLKIVSGFWRWVIPGWLLIPGSLIAIAFYISI